MGSRENEGRESLVKRGASRICPCLPRRRRAGMSKKRQKCIQTDEDTYDLQEVIGEGTFSVVYKAQPRKDPTATVAIKRLKHNGDCARIRDEIAQKARAIFARRYPCLAKLPG